MGEPYLKGGKCSELHGCGFGIAIFERIKDENFNPNVALEVGYMLALKKDICSLKDKTLSILQADILSKLYEPFSIDCDKRTLRSVLNKWLANYGYIDTND